MTACSVLGAPLQRPLTAGRPAHGQRALLKSGKPQRHAQRQCASKLVLAAAAPGGGEPAASASASWPSKAWTAAPLGLLAAAPFVLPLCLDGGSGGGSFSGGGGGGGGGGAGANEVFALADASEGELLCQLDDRLALLLRRQSRELMCSLSALAPSSPTDPCAAPPALLMRRGGRGGRGGGGGGGGGGAGGRWACSRVQRRLHIGAMQTAQRGRRRWHLPVLDAPWLSLLLPHSPHPPTPPCTCVRRRRGASGGAHRRRQLVLLRDPRRGAARRRGHPLGGRPVCQPELPEGCAALGMLCCAMLCCVVAVPCCAVPRAVCGRPCTGCTSLQHCSACFACCGCAGFACSRAELSEDIKQLYQTGLFESVNARVLPLKKGNKFKVGGWRDSAGRVCMHGSARRPCACRPGQALLRGRQEGRCSCRAVFATMLVFAQRAGCV